MGGGKGEPIMMIPINITVEIWLSTALYELHVARGGKGEAVDGSAIQQHLDFPLF